MATAQSPTSVVLTWTPVTGEQVDGYGITFSYQGPCSGITLTNTATVGATSRSHTQTGLQEFSNYIVSVAAVNSGGRGTQTQMVTTMSSGIGIMLKVISLLSLLCQTLHSLKHSGADRKLYCWCGHTIRLNYCYRYQE